MKKGVVLLASGLLAAVSLLFITPTISHGSGPSKEPFHAQLKRAIFRLEHRDIISRVGQDNADVIYRSDGTGFVVNHNGRSYLISARHVADIKYDLRARVPARLIESGNTDVIELRIPKEAWVFHPQGPFTLPDGSKASGVDIAVAPLTGIKEREIVGFLSCVEPCKGEKNQLSNTDPTPPLNVFVVGFPLDIGFKLSEQTPILRSGTVALVATERFLTIGDRFVDELSFLVDCKVHPGNSGSPIFNMNIFSGDIQLVGLIIATNNNVDFSIGEPASRIREAIEHAMKNPPSKMAEWHRLPAK